MMEKMKEMKQWWQEVMLEVEDAESHLKDTNVSLLFPFFSVLFSPFFSVFTFGG